MKDAGVLRAAGSPALGRQFDVGGTQIGLTFISMILFRTVHFFMAGSVVWMAFFVCWFCFVLLRYVVLGLVVYVGAQSTAFYCQAVGFLISFLVVFVFVCFSCLRFCMLSGYTVVVCYPQALFVFWC